jgi:hypothetical protein
MIGKISSHAPCCNKNKIRKATVTMNTGIERIYIINLIRNIPPLIWTSTPASLNIVSRIIIIYIMGEV